MSNANVESGGETSSIGNRATVESSSCETPITNDDSIATKDDKEKTCENGSDTTPKPVSRPSYIPPHLMGRDLNDPAQDMVGTGRRVQKPRLGVKVPYRNLTSQIVSQDEIAQEILERSLRKYSYSEVPEGGDVFFAMKLTHRLANKITPSVESSNEKAGSSSDGASGDTTVVSAAKKTETAEVSIKRNVIDVSAAVADKSKEIERKSEAIGSKKCLTSEKNFKTSHDHSNDTSKSDACVNFESKADQLYAEISSTLGEDCKIGKSLKMTSPNVNSHTKTASSRMANGSITQTATETELDNDTLLAILEGTSDVHDVSTDATVSSPKLEVVPQPQQQQQQQQPSPPSPQKQQQPLPLPLPQQHQRKKRIKPMLDPNVEKELALKQLMDFETKKNEDRLKKSAAKKLRLDEETYAVSQHPSTDTTDGSNSNQNSNVACNNGKVSSGGGGDNDNVDAVQSCNASTAVSAASVDTTRQDVKPTLPDVSKYESTPSGKKPKKSSFSGGSIAPKRFPKKYQRIIKRQLRSSKLKAKTTSPDQQQQLQKRLPEVPEVQIAIDRYIKTYASKRKHKPETEVKEKAAEKNISAEPICETIVSKTPSNDALARTAAQTSGSGPDKRSPAHPQTAAAAKEGADGQANVNDDDDDEKTGVVAGSGVDEEIKENSSPATAKPKANSKVMREINRLLGDEGAINMIYSIEQKRLPDSKRDTNILPSLRRKKKDLLLKTKLVKNAVLRLSMSPGQLSPGRVRRTSPEISTAQSAAGNVKSITSPPRKASVESLDSNTSEHSPKVRKVAAEASRIIRRHSSSSAYSSDEDESAAANATGKTAPTSVNETAKNKQVVDKSATVSQTQLAAADVRTAQLVESAKSRDNTKESTQRTNDNRSGNRSNNGGNENENSVQVTKNNDSRVSAVAERRESTTGTSSPSAAAAVASSSVAGATSSSKRKDSKEGSGVAAKMQNESSTNSSYSGMFELVHHAPSVCISLIFFFCYCRTRRKVTFERNYPAKIRQLGADNFDIVVL